MKTIQAQLYEPGDHLMVIAGRNKGKIGIVFRHSTIAAKVYYKLADRNYNTDDEDDYDDDDDIWGMECSETKFLQYLTKKEYEEELASQKILMVPGLPVTVKFVRTNLVIGDNVITPTNAKKIAQFITENTRGKKNA